MSMFSPADRDVAMTLPCFHSSTRRVVNTRRSSSISISTGTSPSVPISSCGVIARFQSADQVDGVLAQLILRRYHPRIGLIPALVDDQVGEFPGDVRGRCLQ